MDNNRVILDDQFDEIRQIKIDDSNSELLYVHQEKWLSTVTFYERRFNVGCYVLVLIIPLFAAGAIFYKMSWIFWIFSLFAIIIKIINTQKAKHLKQHGGFTFEIGIQKIVRYSASKYTIFQYDDIIEVQESNFGLILLKKKQLTDYIYLSLFKPKRQSQLIIPRNLYAYDQVKEFLYKRLH